MKKFWLGFLSGMGFSFLAMVVLGYVLGRMMGFDEEGLSKPDLTAARSTKNYHYDLHLKDLETDSVVSDAIFEDRVMFLNFWEHWCGPCKKEMPSLERLYNTVKDSTIFFGVISTEAPELTRKDNIVEKYKLPFYYTNKILPAEIKDDIVPRTYIIDRKKNIVVAEIGAAQWDDTNVVKLIDSLKAKDK